MPENNKEVMFCKYCGKCKYIDILYFDEPCNECLETPVREGTEVPVNFKEIESKN